MDPLNRNGNAAGTNYTPATPGDWSPPPNNAAEALDQLAAKGEVTEVTATAPVASSGGPSPNISIAPATDSTAGSMSATDKLKLDLLPAAPVASVGATAPITSTGGANPTIGITSATDLADGSMSAADKTKLDALAASTVPYSPAVPGNWSPSPTQVAQALDDISGNTITKYHPIIPGNVKPLTSGVPVSLLQIDLTQTVNPPFVNPDYSFACKLFFACECTDGNAVQIRQGDCNAAVAYNHNTATYANSQAVNATAAITDGGTLTVVFSWSTSGTIATLQVTSTTSLGAPTEFVFHYFSNHATHPFTYL